MFFERVDAENFAKTLDENINSNYLASKQQGQRRVAGVVLHLHEAAHLLQAAGFIKEARCVNLISQKIEKDPATDNLSYEDMVKNLLNRGWVFNAADDGLIADSVPVFNIGDTVRRIDRDGQPYGPETKITGVVWNDQLEMFMYKCLWEIDKLRDRYAPDWLTDFEIVLVKRNKPEQFNIDDNMFSIASSETVPVEPLSARELRKLFY